jgi:hypothetical protein
MEANHIQVFAPGVRSLTEVELSQLPKEKAQVAEAISSGGIWLDIPCPELACLTGEDRITFSVKGAPEKESKWSWMDLFCPGDACEVRQATDLP